MERETEEQILSRCRRGDPAAWEMLFREHYETLSRFIFQVGADLLREDVEEIAQEVFITVVRTLNNFQGGSRFQTWLYRVAANKVSDYRQKMKAAKRGGGAVRVSLEGGNSFDEAPLDPPGPELSPDKVMMRQENLMLLRQALDELGEPCKETIELRYFGDLSYEEIAQLLGDNPKTVSSRLSKCLDRMENVARSLGLGEKSAGYSV